LLAAANRLDLARTFLARIAELGKGPPEKLAAVRIAQEIGGLDLVVAIAKEAIRNDSPFVREAYPGIDVPTGRLERALMLAVTRQESGFDPEALSPAGARGLMQLMPATARMVARKLGADFADHRLTDPQYNIRLGSTYLADMIDTYGGHYVLALAAYNAGPGRVKAWLGDYGDPRAGAVDLIDWIESIPFSETRSYVQRVVEGLRIYRVIAGDAPQVAAAFDSGQGR
jgi:soluble lytic murein transglycosylase